MSNRPNTRQPNARPARPGATAAPPSRSLLWPIVIGVIVLAGIAAIAVTALGGSDDENDTATESTSADGTSDSGSRGGESGEAPDPRDLEAVSVSGTALPGFESPTDDPAVGEVAPVLEGVDMYGEPMTIGADGQPTVVVFLAHWCPHCQREVPIIADWLEENGAPEGVRLVGVTTSFAEERGNWPPAEWLEDEGWTLPTMVDPSGEAAETWGLTAFPYFVAIDGEGQVVARASGEISMSQLQDLVDAAAAGSGGTADPA